jgi:hypothetical protein
LKTRCAFEYKGMHFWTEIAVTSAVEWGYIELSDIIGITNCKGSCP